MSALSWLVAALTGLCASGGEIAVDRDIVFAQPDGIPLKLDVYRPAGAQAGTGALRPGLLMVHGGAWIIGPREQQMWYCREFARMGYVVAAIDYRMMPKHPFPCCIEDCKAGVRWLRKHAAEYGVDPAKIVAFGASAGGHLATLLAATRPEDGFEGTENLGVSSEVSAVVSLYGAVDLTQYRDRPWDIVGGPLSRLYIRSFVGNEGEKQGKDPFAYASPITYAHAGMPPVFMIHGNKDHLVHWRQSQAFYEKLQSLGVKSDFKIVPKRFHGFDYVFKRQRANLFQDMLAFLAPYSGIAPSPAPPEDLKTVDRTGSGDAPKGQEG